MAHDGQSERDGGGRALAGDGVAVDHYGLGLHVGAGFDAGWLKTGIARGALALEQAERGEHHGGRCADGGQASAGGCVGLQQGAEGLELHEVGGAGHAAWADEPSGVGEVDLIKGQVGVDRHAVGSGHCERRTDGDCGHVHAGAAEDINCGEGFDFFKSLSEEEV